jgi:hypothetical protein
VAKKQSRRTAKKPVKRNARSLHIGLNSVNPEHYEGWSGPLAACELDANDMRDLAKGRGIKASVLLTRDATRTRTLAGIRAAVKALKAGDLFFLSYSGHGGQVDDVSGEDEPDKLDETWCLFDGQLIDDELYFELTKFKKGRADHRAVRQLSQRHCHPGEGEAAAKREIDASSQGRRGLQGAQGLLRWIAKGHHESHEVGPC